MRAEAPLTYQQNPRPIGFPLTFRLDGRRLAVDSTRRVDEIDVADIGQLRLTCEFRNMAGHLFKAKASLKDGRSFALTSIHWSSTITPERRNAEYRAFVVKLIAAIGQASPECRLIGGKPRLQWIGLAVLGGLALVAALAFTGQALAAGAYLAASLGGAITAFGLWQIAPMVLRNRPRLFTAAAVPQDLLP
jgi:hypothetical protein